MCLALGLQFISLTVDKIRRALILSSSQGNALSIYSLPNWVLQSTNALIDKNKQIRCNRFESKPHRDTRITPIPFDTVQNNKLVVVYAYSVDNHYSIRACHTTQPLKRMTRSYQQVVTTYCIRSVCYSVQPSPQMKKTYRFHYFYSFNFV